MQSDECVYVLDALDLERDACSGIAKNYDRGELWLECWYSMGRNSYFAAIMRRYDFCRNINLAEHVDAPSCDPHRDSPALFDSVDLVQLPQHIGACWNPRRSMVWLKRFDDLDCFVRESEGIFLKSPSGLGVILGENRELSPFGVGMSLAGKPPDSLIKSRSETLENVPSHQIDESMGLPEDSPVDHKISFAVLFNDYGLGMSIKGGNLGLEFVQVMLRPFALKIGVDQRTAVNCHS